MLNRVFSKMIKRGSLTVTWPDNSTNTYGAGPPSAAIAIHGKTTPWSIALRPDPNFGEAYMDGRLTVQRGKVADVLEILLINMGSGQSPRLLQASRKVRRWLRPITRLNNVPRAQKNVRHHYDLSAELYSLFLDDDKQYSCGYFSQPGMTLEAAQKAKKRHIARKLCLNRPKLKVLDIGSGWGGLAVELARTYGADVTGITLSTEQLAVARHRAALAGGDTTCRFEMQDYRRTEGVYDRIVSVGMFEHVGTRHYDTFFSKLRELLADGGVALIHTIGRSDGPGTTPEWISKYIFPGGYAPALSEIIPPIERSGLHISDVEVWRLHYAETLKEWRARFEANRARVSELYDERFCRMWEFYLAAAEMTFRYDKQVIFQIQLTKQVGALPLTRDYMYRHD
jgi:cyclopropane-fatty-acyl-phospholipid synthase